MHLLQIVSFFITSKLLPHILHVPNTVTDTKSDVFTISIMPIPLIILSINFISKSVSVLFSFSNTSIILLAFATLSAPSWNPNGLMSIPPLAFVSIILYANAPNCSWLILDVVYLRHSTIIIPSPLLHIPLASISQFVLEPSIVCFPSTN